MYEYSSQINELKLIGLHSRWHHYFNCSIRTGEKALNLYSEDICTRICFSVDFIRTRICTYTVFHKGNQQIFPLSDGGEQYQTIVERGQISLPLPRESCKSCIFMKKSNKSGKQTIDTQMLSYVMF